jgi:nitrogen regulatory protein PII
MTYNEITATVDVLAMKRVRRALKHIGVPGVSVFQVRGYGDHKNFYRRGWMQQHSCVRVIAEEEETDHIVQTIMDAAHTGMEGDGIIAINPLSRFYNIREKKRLDA